MSDPAERLFCQLMLESLELWRGGWPDYLARHRHTDQVIGIEVKRGNGKITPSQERMFEALEGAKMSIFVWNPQTPTQLIPWRDYQRGVFDVARCLEVEVLSQVPVEDHSRKFKLAQIREQLGITQQELAARAGLDQSAVSRLELQDDCLISTLERYAEALGGELVVCMRIDGEEYPITLKSTDNGTG